MQVRRLASAAGMWLFCVTSLSFAQHINAKDAPCHTPATGAEETACFAEAYLQADLKLNRLYGRIERVLGEKDRAHLKNAQRLWVQFRDANCSAEYNLHEGGSAAPMVKAACLEATTRHRIEELEVMYGWRLEKFEK